MAKKVALSLVGKQGSGKSTLGSKLARNLGTERIEISDVVKELVANKKREQLAESGVRTRKEPDWLAMPVYEKMFPVFNAGKQTVVLTGVRELAIHKYLQRKGLYVLPIDITARPMVRYLRVLELEKVLNPIEFLDQELREKRLGIDEVCDAAKYEIETSPETDPDKIVRSLISVLTKEGQSVR